MINKKNILDNWIMIERLSEGNWNEKDYKKIQIQGNDYYESFSKNFKNKNECLILIFKIFNSKELIYNFLSKENNYEINNDELELIGTNKFSFAICFNDKLELIKEFTFYTWSAYLKENDVKLKFPSEFEKKEKELSENIENIFTNERNEDQKAFFNKAFKEFIESYEIDMNFSRYKTVYADAVDPLLHSFFIKDLEKAKNISTENLDKYLSLPDKESGKKIKRINLDNKHEEGIEKISEILEPKKYPYSRFPSNSKYSLSLMQQVALNIIINENYDNIQMKSVNGPPGTGKTTLLKDVFAELICRQAYQIVKLNLKNIKYYSKPMNKETTNKIGKLPIEISDKGIFVVSSNNTAVQNIVNELPLLDKIDDNLKEKLKAVNYFRKTANSKKNEENNAIDSENNKSKNDVEYEKWGLFSLEGGKKTNLNNIIEKIEDVIEELNEYSKNRNNNAYEEYLELYNKIEEQKNNIQETLNKLKFLQDESKKIINVLNEQKNLDDNNINFSLNLLLEEGNKYKSEIKNYDYSLKLKEDEVYIKKLKMPSWISQLFKTKKYKKHFLELENLIDEKKSLIDLRNKVKNKIKLIEKLKENKEYIDKIDKYLVSKNIKVLDFNVENSEFQLSNPWFNQEYREMQSNLFILSLKVRKHFLSYNMENLREAKKILDDKWKNKVDIESDALHQAWYWINMVVPVISSTFASISRMFGDFKENSIGYLFVDEAGQAVPQAAVGAIFRSKNITVVGDPSQIEPVSVLDKNTLKWITKKYNLPEEINTSVQEIFDSHSKFGFYKKIVNELVFLFGYIEDV
ncbi:AAA domain-containing protein [Mesomycoplasma molare]|uniref:DNA2/NAM7 helicase helicase domain-containing protein n=1 Tax=Mesomycoplasma molare TaxID=171288 RepID=A0ABY5TUS1_9BACT|nr:AAA domain-containing protein [Mesomycoplasma molare]UWD34402.1 hypothetical protein NX772_01055 [Mesomycoplasma molare]